MPQIAGKQIKIASIPGSKLESLAIDTAQLAATGVTAAKLGGDVAGTGLSGGSGSAIGVDTSSGSVTFTAGTWSMPTSVLQVTGTPSSANDATNVTYVENAVSGLNWKDPIDVLQLVGNADCAAINLLTPTAGDAYVVTDADTITSGSISTAIGDVVEYSGSVWIRIVAGAGGYVATGTRACLATQTALITPYTDATDDGKIADFAGSLTGTLTVPSEGWALLVIGDGGFYENSGFTFTGTVPTGAWVQFTGAGQINAGAGLTKDGNTINVGAGTGISVNANDVAFDATAADGNGLTGSGAVLTVQPDQTPGTDVRAVVVEADGVGIDVDVMAGEGLETNSDATLRLSAQSTGIAGGAGTALSFDATAADGDGLTGSGAVLTVDFASTSADLTTAVSAQGSDVAAAREDHTHQGYAPKRADTQAGEAPGGALDNFAELTYGLDAKPALTSDIMVFVNGIQVLVANSIGEAQGADAECYFAPTGDDDGSTAVAISAVDSDTSGVEAHFLYWKGANATYDLATSDEIKFSYVASQA